MIPKSNHQASSNFFGFSGKFLLALLGLVTYINFVQARSFDFEKDSLSASFTKDLKTPAVITGKIYIVEGTVTHNFEKNEKIFKKRNYVRKNRSSTTKSKKPLQPPIVKKDTEPENRTGVLSFRPKEKIPSALFYAGKITKAAFLHNGSPGVKSFTSNNLYNTIHTFLLNDNKEEFINECLHKQQIHLKNQITRPPPVGFQFYP